MSQIRKLINSFNVFNGFYQKDQIIFCFCTDLYICLTIGTTATIKAMISINSKRLPKGLILIVLWTHANVITKLKIIPVLSQMKETIRPIILRLLIVQLNITSAIFTVPNGICYFQINDCAPSHLRIKLTKWPNYCNICHFFGGRAKYRDKCHIQLMH